MTERRWEIGLNGVTHVIELTHGYVSGKRSIRVDGKPLPMSRAERWQFADKGSTHHFDLDGHNLAVLIIPNGLQFSYDLEIDGRSVSTGQSTNLEQIQKQESTRGRWGLGIFLMLIGLGAGWVNWNWAHDVGHYSEKLAFITPAPIILGIYFMLYPDDYVDQYHRKFSYRSVIVLVLIFLLGFANAYALSRGMY